MSRLDELEAMEREATAGPWKVCGANDSKCQCGMVWALTPDLTVCRTAMQEGDEVERNAATMNTDAALIAAARNALPDLIATARAGIALYESRGVNDCGTDDGACLNRETCESCTFRAALARLNGGGA